MVGTLVYEETPHEGIKVDPWHMENRLWKKRVMGSIKIKIQYIDLCNEKNMSCHPKIQSQNIPPFWEDNPKLPNIENSTSGLAFWPYWISFARSHPKFSFKSIFTLGWVTVTDFMNHKTQCSSHPSHETLHFHQQTPWFRNGTIRFSCKSFSKLLPFPKLKLPSACFTSPVLVNDVKTRCNSQPGVEEMENLHHLQDM